MALDPLAKTPRPGNCYDAPTLLPTVVYVAFALLPRIVTAVMQAMRISASMTAYSTEVGPSSSLTNATKDRGSHRSILTFLSNQNIGEERPRHSGLCQA